ncbi:MAG: right-handed parallel beta-helix repeat-containing protein [Deltaproteobacteria bacterium]|jgi:hypothetical protein|nr:right-handed parallel beta-helix repeat-containing protein [Deltaproteobacteria bacterium]MBW2532069.1 right-handed parallel beta-helix repeat-containing protein [Deltaproteobacteria bacterium]
MIVNGSTSTWWAALVILCLAVGGAACDDETTTPATTTVGGGGSAGGGTGGSGLVGGADTGGSAGAGADGGSEEPGLPTLGECDPASIPGTVRVVDPSDGAASDTNDGTPTAPWATLQHAVATVQPGETVLVRAGTYTDADATSFRGFNPAAAGTETEPIVLRSCPHLAAVLVAPSDTTVALGVYLNQYVVVDGFRAEGMLKATGSDHVTIENCEVVHGSTEGNDPSLNWGICIHSSDDCIVRNNRVHSLADSGNQQHNTACIMVGFGAARNRVEFNDADASDGLVYSAYGQKGGDIVDNLWRRNVARRATTGFLGMGSTDGTRFATDNTFAENVILESDNAFELDHNCTGFEIRNNTAVGVATFLNGGFLEDADVGNSDATVLNNVVVSATGRGFHRGPSSVDWHGLLTTSDYNLWNVASLASWNWGSATHDSLDDWQTAEGFDPHSLDDDAALVDPSGGDVHLGAASPGRGAADDGRDVGAYPTGNEHIGPTW